MKDFLGQELYVGDNVVIVKKEKISWKTNMHLLKCKITKLNNKYVSTDNGKRTVPESIIKIDTIINNINNEC